MLAFGRTLIYVVEIEILVWPSLGGTVGSAIYNTRVRWMDTGQTNRYRTNAYTALCIRNAYARPV